MNLNSTVMLHNGVELPRLGLGVWRAEGSEAENAVKTALQQGYRLVDTATLYGNEAAVGQGIRESGVAREEVFVTSKVWIDSQGYDKTMAAFEASLQRLGLETLDMYMIHWPVEGLWLDTWRTLEQLYRDGRVRAIGVCNFPARLLAEMEGVAEVMPMVNQVEFHPLYNREEILAYCNANHIAVQAWAPLARGRLSANETIVRIAQKHGKSPEQVLLRWDLQLGLCTIPKSVHAVRMAQNADVFDFTLDEEDMGAVHALNQSTSVSAPPDGVMLS